MPIAHDSPLAVLGADGRVEFVNAPMKLMLGMKPEGWEDFPHGTREAGVDVEVPSGAHTRFSATQVDDRWIVQAQDITREHELELRLETIAALHRDVEQAEFDVDEVVVWILNRARSLIGARAASVGIVEHDEIVYRYRSAEGENPNGQIRAARVASLSGICARTGQTVVCTDSETDPRVDIAACRAQGLRSMIIVPLRCRGPVVGVLNVNAPDPDAFDASDVQTLELIAGAISGAYGHAVDLAAKRELLDELETTVAALKNSEAELARQALHDPLTGLPNRTLFHDRLRTALARRDLPEDGVGVMFVDLDGFKHVNDTHGHDAGDAVLIAAAQRIRRALREGDTVARIGGDEFLVLLEGESAETLGVHAAKRILESLGAPFPLPGGVVVTVAASVGITSGRRSDDALVCDADAAMYRAKADGRGCYRIFEPNMRVTGS